MVNHDLVSEECLEKEESYKCGKVLMRGRDHRVEVVGVIRLRQKQDPKDCTSCIYPAMHNADKIVPQLGLVITLMGVCVTYSITNTFNLKIRGIQL